MSEKLSKLTHFFLELDQLKLVNRRTYINGGERLENSAEHSWHLAIACWSYAEFLGKDYDIDKLIKLALVHDIGEMHAGDTFLYSHQRTDAHIEERKGVELLSSHPGNPIKNLVALWDEQEEGRSKESKLLKVIDRLLPFLHNINSEGRAWRDHGVRKEQVLGMHQFISVESPEIHDWFLDQVDFAVKQGWLIE